MLGLVQSGAVEIIESTKTCWENWSDSVGTLMLTITLSAVGILILKGWYLMVGKEWPEAYVSTLSLIERKVRQSPFHTFIVFRGAPVFVVVGVLAAYTARVGGQPAFTAAIIVAVHLWVTNARALRQISRDKVGYRNLKLILYHIFTILVVVLFGVIAYILRGVFDKYLPGGEEVGTAFLSAILASIITLGVRASLVPSPVNMGDDIDSVIQHSRSDAGQEVWSYLESAETPNEAIRSLAEVIILAECYQRPRWIRRLERIVGRFLGTATYGVAQQPASRPIDDLTSINYLLANLVNTHAECIFDKPLEARDIRQVFFKHNPDEMFVKLCCGLFERLHGGQFGM